MKRFGQAIVPLASSSRWPRGPASRRRRAAERERTLDCRGRRPAADRRPPVAARHPRLVPADVRRSAGAERIPGATRRMVGASARRRQPPCDRRTPLAGSHCFARRRVGHHRRPDRRDCSVGHAGGPRRPARLARVAGDLGDPGGFGADPDRRPIRRRARDAVARPARDGDLEGVRSESGRDAAGRVADGPERRRLRRAEARLHKGDAHESRWDRLPAGRLRQHRPRQRHRVLQEGKVLLRPRRRQVRTGHGVLPVDPGADLHPEPGLQ